jgi:hypothetical protein
MRMTGIDLFDHLFDLFDQASMRDEAKKLGKEQVKLRTELLMNPLLGQKLLRLFQSGLTEQHIINVGDYRKA